MSLPKTTEHWADLKGAYRLLHAGSATPEAMLAPHRAQTLKACAGHAVVLVLADTTELDFSTRRAAAGLGPIGDGNGLGLLLHSALAATTGGSLLGVLDLRYLVRGQPHTDETRTELAARWRESMLWGEGIERAGPAPAGCRFILVADRASDCFETLEACDRNQAGFVIRAVRRRNVEDGHDDLWSWAAAQPRQGTARVRVSRQAARGRTKGRIERTAEVTIRFGPVTLDAPRRSGRAARAAWAVYAREENPPTGEGVEPVEWMLLCSEPVESLADAKKMIEWYRHRWVIEEWHRAMKEGCRLEWSQLQDAAAIQRLATLLAVVAARLVQLRDLADPDHPEADSPEALKRQLPAVWLQVVCIHRNLDPDTLTPRQFYLALARRGGFLGRKSDGRPGWKALWQGWLDYHNMTEFALALKGRKSCG